MNNHDVQANDQGEKQDGAMNAQSSLWPSFWPSLLWHDVLICLSFFSRLPVNAPDQGAGLAGACRGFGIAGLILGVITGLIYTVVSMAGPAPLPSVIIALAIGAIMTGGLHEDGLADVADGFGGGWTKERKLEIMRDSHIGTYGVLALVFSVGFRIVAYTQIINNLEGTIAPIFLFAAIGCLSRAPLVLMMYQMPLARDDGRAAQAGKPSHDKTRASLFISFLFGAICLAVAVNITALVAVVTGIAIAYFAMAKLADAQIGGHTGDVLGALQQTVEFACLLALLCLI